MESTAVLFQDDKGLITVYCTAANFEVAELIADSKNDELDQKGLPGFYFTTEGR